MPNVIQTIFRVLSWNWFLFGNQKTATISFTSGRGWLRQKKEKTQLQAIKEPFLNWQKCQKIIKNDWTQHSAQSGWQEYRIHSLPVVFSVSKAQILCWQNVSKSVSSLFCATSLRHGCEIGCWQSFMKSKPFHFDKKSRVTSGRTELKLSLIKPKKLTQPLRSYASMSFKAKLLKRSWKADRR